MEDVEPGSHEERQQQIMVKLRRDELNALFDNTITFLFTVPFVVPLYQAWQWLQYGKWQPLTFALLFDSVVDRMPITSWIGLQYIMDEILDVPLFACVYLISVCGWVLTKLTQKMLLGFNN